MSPTQPVEPNFASPPPAVTPPRSSAGPTLPVHKAARKDEGHFSKSLLEGTFFPPKAHFAAALTALLRNGS